MVQGWQPIRLWWDISLCMNAGSEAVTGGEAAPECKPDPEP